MRSESWSGGGGRKKERVASRLGCQTPTPPLSCGICEGTAAVGALAASRRGGNNGYVTTGGAEAKGAETFVMGESGGGGAQTDRQTADIHECKAGESRRRMPMSDIKLV